MWQYSDKGHITGINGRVDLDKAYKDYSKIIKKAGLNGWNDSASEKPKTIEIGKKLTLVSTPLYTSSNSKTPATFLIGTYYVYDGEIINGRIRITPKKEWCLKKPLTGYVTGWIKF
jgi:GH25 family lysozyme M1 (1,4-beta-N-acetylmuramidase)